MAGCPLIASLFLVYARAAVYLVERLGAKHERMTHLKVGGLIKA